MKRRDVLFSRLFIMNKNFLPPLVLPLVNGLIFSISFADVFGTRAN